MDDKRFDQLAKSLSAGGTRRGVLHLLAGLPLGGVLALLLGQEPTDAKRRKKGKPKKKRRVGGENHKHGHRRRKHRNRGKNHHKDKKKPCLPRSTAQTCDGTCGTVANNCKKSVDCGSCACDPACPTCQICDDTSGQCQPDPAQHNESCGGCLVCDTGQCITDETIVCTASDQCHDAGVCDPRTGACTNPAKEVGTPCDDGDPCTINDTCQNGICTGVPKDCSTEADVCNAGVCREADGACVREPRADGTPCGTGGHCVDGACQEACLALRERCDLNDNQCCADGPRDCAKDGPFSGDVCCIPVGASCAATGFGCCGVDFGDSPSGPLVGLVNCVSGICCQEPGDGCLSVADCCQSGVPLQCRPPARPDCITAPLKTCCQAAGTPCTGPCQCCDGFCVDGLCSAT